MRVGSHGRVVCQKFYWPCTRMALDVRSLVSRGGNNQSTLRHVELGRSVVRIQGYDPVSNPDFVLGQIHDDHVRRPEMEWPFPVLSHFGHDFRHDVGIVGDVGGNGHTWLAWSYR